MNPNCLGRRANGLASQTAEQVPLKCRDITHRWWVEGHGDAGIKRETLETVVPDRYPLTMSEARNQVTDQDIDPVDLAWLEGALEEYRELLEYLRDHWGGQISGSPSP
jgi:hypothetical protein